MSNYGQDDAFLMFLRMMSGEKNVVENMEREGHEKAIRQGLMPKEMCPAKEEWEKIGFVFKEIDDDLMYSVTLPEGWSRRMTDHDMHSEIVDANGLVRGTMFYKASFYDRKANMVLLPRYKITYKHDDLDDNSYVTTIYFGNENEMLYVAGEVLERYDASVEEFYVAQEERRRLEEACKAYALENYPDYDSEFAYWDLPVVKTIK